MAVGIEIENKEDRIRAILGVDAADISDDVINYPEYYLTAMAWAKLRVKTWEELTDEMLQKFQSLILFKTAQMLLPLCQASVWNVQKEKTTHSEVSYFAARPNIVSANILDNIGELLGDLTSDYTNTYFFGFDRSGRR